MWLREGNEKPSLKKKKDVREKKKKQDLKYLCIKEDKRINTARQKYKGIKN